MRVKVRLFASLREEVGQELVELEVPAECSVDSLIEAFNVRYPEAGRLGPVLVAVNQEVGGPDTLVGEDDEVALLPPVSGG